VASRTASVLVMAAFGSSWPGSVWAQPPPPAERGGVYSEYERDTIDQVVGSLRTAIDPKPEGKTLEHIEVVPLDVFEPRDPLPQWLNVFHATTRRAVIRREMLLREGDRYRQTLIDETLRNLRVLPQLSLVLAVATRGSAPDRVAVVIITKDVWSLRASWDVTFTPGGLEDLLIEPTETNLLGSHQSVLASIEIQPSATTFGAGYSIPRLEDSRIALVLSADVMVNRATGSVEGSYGSMVAGEPLYSGLTPWSWASTASWTDIVARRYVNAQLSEYVDPSTGESLPFEYRWREYDASLGVTRSFGWDTKHDITLSLGMDRANYLVAADGRSATTVADFSRFAVPLSDTRVGPTLQYHSYTKRYVRVIDFDTLALQEDFRLGHDVVARVYPSFRALGASRDVLGLYAAAQYTVAVRDGLFRVFFASTTEPEIDRIADASLNPGAHLVSPTLAGAGRIVLDGALLYRWRNYLNQVTYVGGGDRLRGFPTNFFVGKDWLAYNVEVRSRPLEILKCQLGGVAFFDVAEAFDGFDNFRPYQSVGGGFRVLIPQLDRIVFRGDLGFPIERPVDPSTKAPIPPFGFVVSFGQAFDTPTVSPTPVLPTEQ
jgi:hypothetical protein